MSELPDMSGSVLTEWESIALLGDIPRPRQRLTHSVDDAVGFAGEVDRPVVAKASGIAHKSDVFGVRAGLHGTDVADVWPELASLGDGTVLVAEQLAGIDYELIVGAFRDREFGPVAMVGMGGILAEVLSDVTFLAGRIGTDDVERALRGLRAHPLLAGARGRRGIDVPALRDLLERVVRILSDRPDVTEVECNPVAVTDGSLSVLDALVACAAPEDQETRKEGTR